METSKAIKILREHRNRAKNVLNDLRPGASARNLVYEDIEAFDMAIEALERQIPKKPTLEYSDNVSKKVFGGVCECSTTLSMNYKYCPRCGQKIEWSEVE